MTELVLYYQAIKITPTLRAHKESLKEHLLWLNKLERIFCAHLSQMQQSSLYICRFTLNLNILF